MAEDGVRYGISTPERKNPPKGLIALSALASRNENTHSSGAQISDSSIVFFSPSRNMLLPHKSR